MLQEFEAQVQETINVEKVKEELTSGLNHNLAENKILKDEFDVFLSGRAFTTEFGGISIMILNANGREPYYIARMHLYESNNKTEGAQIATYEIEYSADGEILDDFLVF